MPRFRVTAPNGRSLVLVGDQPPEISTIKKAFAITRSPDERSSDRAAIQAEIDAKTEAAAPVETWWKAQMSGAGQLVRAVVDPLIAANRLMGATARPVGPASGPDPTAPSDPTPIPGALHSASELAGAAETASEGMRGNETLAAVSGAVGSGLGSVPYALIPGGSAVSAIAAGGQSYESTRRDALQMSLEAGLPPDEAERIAHRAAAKASIITGGVTGVFNRYAERLGLGKGVERGLSKVVEGVTIEELKRSALRGLASAVIKESLGEGAEEATDQLLQEAFVRWEYDKNRSVLDYVKEGAVNIAKAGGLGAVAGGVIGGPGAMAERIGARREAIRKISTGEAPEGQPTPNSPAVEQKPVSGVPGDTSALSTPIDIPEAAAESPGAPIEGTPSTVIHGTTPTGQSVRVEVGPSGTVEGATQAMRRAVPGARVDRIETTFAPTTGSEPDKESTPEPGVTFEAAGETGVVEPVTTTTTEGVIGNEEGQKVQEQEVLNGPPEEPAAAPEQPAADASGQAEAGIQGKRSATQRTGTETIPIEHLLPGDKFKVQGEVVTVRRYVTNPETDAIEGLELDDGRKFGTQVVNGGTHLVVDKGTIDNSGRDPDAFSIRNPEPAGPEPRRQMTVAQVNEVVRLALPSGALRGVVVSGEPRTRGGSLVEGAMDRGDGRITLYAPNLRTPQDVLRVLRHESLHGVWNDPVTQGAWNRLRASMDRSARVGAALREGYSPETAPEEADLDEIEARADRKATLFRRWIQSITSALVSRGKADVAGALFGLDRLADVDAKALVGYAMRLDRAPQAVGNERFSISPVESSKNTKSESVTKATGEGEVPGMPPKERESLGESVEDIDRHYLDAVSRGDNATAQRMVDVAAQRVLPSPARDLRRAYSEGVSDRARTTDLQFPSTPDWVGFDLPRSAVWDDGFNGRGKPRWVLAERIGKLPKDGRSTNFRDSKAESGVSVLRVVGEERKDNQTFDAFNAGDRVFVAGWEIGKTGSDGEPLLVDAVLVGSAETVVRDSEGRVIPPSQRFTPNTTARSSLGKPFTVYHGTSAPPFSEFVLPKKPEKALFFTDDEGEAEKFSSWPGTGGKGGKPRVLETQIAPGNYAEHDARGELYDPEWLQPLLIRWAGAGKQGGWVRNVVNFEGGRPSDTFVLLDPQKATVLGRASLVEYATPPENESDLRSEAGRAVTPFGAGLARSGASTFESMGNPTFSEWSAEMVKRHGESVRPFLSDAWEHAHSLRYSLANGVSPEAQADINRIVTHAETAPSAFDTQPTPVYDPDRVKKWWMPLSRPSAVIKYFGGDELLRKRQLLDMRTAYQSAAVRRQSEQLSTELEDSFYGDKAGPFLRFMRQFAPKAKLRKFMRTALPLAAHLNVTGGTAGNWTFEDFDQRAGFISESAASRAGLSTGQLFFRVNPLDGSQETLEIGPSAELDDGRKGFQIIRKLPADRQRVIYEWALREFPEFQWFLDQWVDPSLKDTRVEVNGVEVPVFNRWSLATRYSQSDPQFGTRPAYTPDVAIGGSLLGTVRRFIRARRVTFREGTRSPGRKYETGIARESGNVLDLLSGFNVRAMQVLQEDVRTQWAKDVLAAADDVPPEGLPHGWVKVENAMSTVWEAVRAMRKFDNPKDFSETTKRLADDQSPEYKRFFGELLRLKNADKPKMVPGPLVDALLGDMAAVKEAGFVGQIARVWARNWKAFLLLMPDTFVENRTDNYLRFVMAGYRQAVLSAMKGGDRQAFRDARKLVWAAAVNIIPGARRFTNWNSNGLFKAVVDDVLPPEMFEGGQRLADLRVEKKNTTEEVASHLRTGQRAKAVGVIARDLGSLILEKTGYGNLDIAAKQQFAFTMLLSRAEEESWRNGLRGEERTKAIRAWMMKPPEDAVRQAVADANRNLLNYSDTPGWMGKLSRSPWSNLAFAFPLFRYHFVGREIDRATAAFRSAFNVATRGKKLSREQWANALADTISYVTLPLAGFAATQVASALKDSLVGGSTGGDDEDDPRQFVGASSVFEINDDGTAVRKPLPRELVTANRVNVSAMLRQIGIETDSDKDWWWHIKDYPLIRSTALMYLAGEDAKKHGALQGVATLFSGMTDMLSSLAGTGQAIKVGEKLLRAPAQMATGKPSPMTFDPYATGVPLDAYLTLQGLGLIPAQRQANEVLKWLDPVPRRMTSSKVLGYDPGVTEALQSEGWTGLADRTIRGVQTGDFSSPLPPQGRINRRFGNVEEPREFDLPSRVASILGQNVKSVPRREYSEALRK